MNFCVFFVFAVIAACRAEIDWSQVYHMEHEHPAFKDIPRSVESPHGRIVGGDEAIPHQFPHQVGIFVHLYLGETFCGGSLISTKHVLTAAQCVFDAVNFTVVLGAHEIHADESTQVKIPVKKKFVYVEYDGLKLLHDIAILTLPFEVELNENIQLIRLPSKSDADETFTGAKSTISGWGKASDKSSTISPVLRYASNPVIANDVCTRQMFGWKIPPTQICQSGEEKRGACDGDTGGPLIVTESDNKITQIGIASYGFIFGCEANYPSSYTRVSKYLDWIEENSDVNIRP